MAVGCGVDALCDIAAALGWLGVPDEESEALGDVVVVGASQTRVCLDVLDGLGEVVEAQVHGSAELSWVCTGIACLSQVHTNSDFTCKLEMIQLWSSPFDRTRRRIS